MEKLKILLEAEGLLKRVVPNFQEFEEAFTQDAEGNWVNKYLEGVPGYDAEMDKTNDEWNSQETDEDGMNDTAESGAGESAPSDSDSTSGAAEDNAGSGFGEDSDSGFGEDAGGGFGEDTTGASQDGQANSQGGQEDSWDDDKKTQGQSQENGQQGQSQEKEPQGQSQENSNTGF